MNSLHFFKIKNIPEAVFENSIVPGMMRILDQNDNENIAVESFDNYEVIYTFLGQEKTEKLEKFLQNVKILLESRDITEDALKSAENGSDFVETFKDESYKKMLESFLRDYLTVDMILDKINDRGMESLTNLDREILEKGF